MEMETETEQEAEEHVKAVAKTFSLGFFFCAKIAILTKTVHPIYITLSITIAIAIAIATSPAALSSVDNCLCQSSIWSYRGSGCERGSAKKGFASCAGDKK
ncbi:hypothetical protein AWZ03_007545 [Drosophila navojoa]|uniref:Uncharacterized protein n=1 Tax=Drosophila navojoa TaxID=7232 RepID=A0A484BBH6_DRONA|nr:hypothetical protein AWZ03_007545 [Drosophila navojoa]